LYVESLNPESMHVPFESLPPSSRIWIFQSSRKFTFEEKNILTAHLQAFTETWVTHGHPMQASFQLPFDHFVVLAADEGYNAASGCSIDDSVRTVKSVAAQIGADFFNRSLIAFQTDAGIELIALDQLKVAHAAGRWSAGTPTFNNLIATKEQLSEWIIPAGSTWLKRHLSQETLAN
jgi:hypothetical protein